MASFVTLLFNDNKLAISKPIPSELEGKLNNTVSFKRENADDEFNLHLLLQASVNDTFRVDPTCPQRLQKVEGWKARFKHLFRARKEDEAVKQIFRQTVNALNSDLQHRITNEEIDETAVRTYRFVISSNSFLNNLLTNNPSTAVSQSGPLSLVALPEDKMRVCYNFGDKKVYVDIPNSDYLNKKHLPFLNIKMNELDKFSELQQDNLAMLLNANRGTKFRAVPEYKGVGNDRKFCGYRLEKVSSLFGRISYAIKNLGGAEDEKIKQTVTPVLRMWNRYLNSLSVDLPNEVAILKTQRAVIQQFFGEHGILGEAPTKVFKGINKGCRLSFLALPKNTVRLKFQVGAEEYKYLDVTTEKLNYLFENKDDLYIEEDRLFPLYSIAVNSMTRSEKKRNALGDVDFEKQNYKQTHDLYRLFKRKRGTIYTYDTKEQRLKKVKGIRQKISYIRYRSKEQQKVQSRVRTILFSLDRAISQKDSIYTETDEKFTVYQTIFRHFFFGKGSLARMNTKVYNRSSIPETKAETSLQTLLCPDLNVKKQELILALQNLRDYLVSGDAQDLRELAHEVLRLGKRERIEDFFELFHRGEYAELRLEARDALQALTFVESEFAKDLGLDLKRIGDGGSGGARFAFSRYGLKLNVVKPYNEGPHGDDNPKWYAPIKRWFGSAPSALKGNYEPSSEVLSDDFGKHFDITPSTHESKIYSEDFVNSHEKPASVQAFIEESKDLGSYLGINYKANYLPRSWQRKLYEVLPESRLARWIKPELGNIPYLDEELLFRIGLHNFLVGDIDCHFGNILIKELNHKDVSPIASLMTPIYAQTDEMLEKMESIADKDIESFVNRLFHPGKKGLTEEQKKNLKSQYKFPTENKKYLKKLAEEEKKQALSKQQQLLQSYFAAGQVKKHMWNEETKEYNLVSIDVALFKPDGGGSLARHHPKGYLESRFRFLFEILPQFNEYFFPLIPPTTDPELNKMPYLAYLMLDDKLFVSKLKNLVAQQLKDSIQVNSIYEDLIATKNEEVNAWIHSVIQAVLSQEPYVSKNPKGLWKTVEENRKIIETYLKEKRLEAAGVIDTPETLELQQDLHPLEKGLFSKAALAVQEKFISKDKHFHLKRVEGILRTTLERWVVMQHMVQENMPQEEDFISPPPHSSEEEVIPPPPPVDDDTSVPLIPSEEDSSKPKMIKRRALFEIRKEEDFEKKLQEIRAGEHVNSHFSGLKRSFEDDKFQPIDFFQKEISADAS